jgi:hypothetical protein
MLEAAISTLGTMIMFNNNVDKEYLTRIMEGLKEFRYKEPEHTTLDKIIARQAASYRGEKND